MMKSSLRAVVVTPAPVLMLVALVGAGCNSTDMKGTSERLNPTITRDFVQEDYPTTKTVHTQGNRGEPGVTDFEQGDWGALDVLVVVDNSGSMVQEQQNLASKLDPLLSKVAKADWRISVVTTDPRWIMGGCQRALIKKSDPGATLKFMNAVNAGTNGNGIERLFYQAVQGLTCRPFGQELWVRPDSTVVVLFITDEDNCADNADGVYGCQGEPHAVGSYLTNYLSSIRTIGKDAKVYGLYKKPGDASCTTALGTGTRLDQVVNQTGGKWGSICDADYTMTLQAISEDVARIVKYEFDLDYLPDDGTLRILVDGRDWRDFTIEGQKVRFTQPPPFGAKVQVNYRHGASGDMNTAFPLETAPVEGSFQVSVDGQTLDPSQYRWNPNTRKVEFTNPPPERAVIDISYKKEVGLNNVFDLKVNDADPNSMVVMVNDQSVRGFEYDAQAGTVTLAEAPPALAKISISFKRLRG